MQFDFDDISLLGINSLWL